MNVTKAATQAHIESAHIAAETTQSPAFRCNTDSQLYPSLGELERFLADPDVDVLIAREAGQTLGHIVVNTVDGRMPWHYCDPARWDEVFLALMNAARAASAVPISAIVDNRISVDRFKSAVPPLTEAPLDGQIRIELA